MSSNTIKVENSTPNEYITPRPNTEVRLAYNVYTWDMDGMERQRTAWSTIGSYYDYNGDVMYTSNQNQLIKTAGSSGVSVVDNTLGVIANVTGGSDKYNDVGPIILYTDGTYIAGLDNNTVRNHFTNMHTILNTIDLHFIKTYERLNNHSITYTDLHNVDRLGESSYSQLEAENMESWIASTTSNIGTIEENTFAALIGASGGINRVENTGFIYNGLKYDRQYEVLNTWRNFYNYIGTWTYGSNAFSVTDIDNENMAFAAGTNMTSTITQVTDADVVKLGIFKQEFEQLAEFIVSSNNDRISDQDREASTTYMDIGATISSMVSSINIMLGNASYDGVNKYPLVSQTPIPPEVFEMTSNVLATYSSVSNVTDIWYSTQSAIIVDRIPWNSTFIDINDTNTATGFAIVNNRTNTWQYTKFPTIDETWQKVMQNASLDGTSTGGKNDSNLSNYYNIIDRFPIIANANTYSIDSAIEYTTSNDTIVTVPLSQLDLGSYENPNSFSYFLHENNLLNSANNFRFIGMKTESGGYYSNSMASNVISITGFNKILLEDIYENPNNYQIPQFVWSWSNQGDIAAGSTDDAFNVPVNAGISYSMSIQSALKTNGNFLVAGVGQSSNDKGVGYNGVFYIPLPTEIQQNEDARYEDTYWLLTTYTPNINNNATHVGVPNSGQVLYKYTKMNDFITTGVYGGFTPYYKTNKLTAGIVNIPQVSWSSNDYTIDNRTYVSQEENQAAKIGALTTGIMNIIPSINTTNTDFTDEITSNSNKCTIITLNSYEASIIDTGNYMVNKLDDGTNIIRNVMYLNLFGYDDGEYNNLSYDVNRKYIFTFNCHIQATNLNLVSDQINYGTPSLLLVGQFRQRYCKASNPITGYGYQVYPGETKLIPLLNKPLENPVNNVYNVEGTYTLSWDTTGNEVKKAMVQDYTFYIPDDYKKPFPAPSGSSFSQIYSSVFSIGSNGQDVIDEITNAPGSSDLEGNNLCFMNVLDHIYAYILVGENVNPNVKYQFVNNTTWQNDNSKLLSESDLELFAGVNIDTNGNITINNDETGIDSGILGVSEPMFSMTIQKY